MGRMTRASRRYEHIYGFALIRLRRIPIRDIRGANNDKPIISFCGERVIVYHSKKVASVPPVGRERKSSVLCR